MLPIYRQREVGFITKQAGSRLLVVPGTWRNFDYEEMAREIAGGQPGLEILVANRTLPQGDPQQLPPPPEAPDDPADLPVRWYYYTSGTTADPKGAQHTDATICAAAVGMCERLEVTESDRIGCVFPFTHVAGAVYIFSALAFGCTMIVVEGFDAESTPPVLARNEVTLAGAGTPFHMAYLAYQRNHPDAGAAVPQGARLHRRRRAEAAATALRREVRARWCRRRVRLRDDRGADRHDGVCPRRRRDPRQHRRAPR